MSKETTYAGMLGSWQRWLASLLANGDLEYLQVQRGKLEALMAEGQDLIRRQSELTASKQDLSKRLREVMTEGQRLMTVIKGTVRQHYGIGSEKLAEFGVQPFRGRRRKVDEPPVEKKPQAE